MDNEKIFVLVPVYKAETYLERCISSIINQTYTNWELVLVDDGSPDNSGAICDRYAAEYDNVTVIHQENRGVAVARNTGVAYALENGDGHRDWLNFIDSDDYVHPRYLEYLHQAVAETGLEIRCCRFSRTSGQDHDLAADIAFEYTCVSPEDYWNRFSSNSVMPVAKLYRLRLFDAVRYPAGKIHEDTFTTHKLMFQLDRIASSETRLYYYYKNPESITSSVWTPDRMVVLDALEEQLAFFRKNGYSRAYRPIVQFLLWSANKQVMMIRGLSPKYDEFLETMKTRRNQAFRLYSDEVGFCKAVAYLFRIRFIEPAKRILKTESIFSFLIRRIRKILHLR